MPYYTLYLNANNTKLLEFIKNELTPPPPILPPPPPLLSPRNEEHFNYKRDIDNIIENVKNPLGTLQPIILPSAMRLFDYIYYILTAKDDTNNYYLNLDKIKFTENNYIKDLTPPPPPPPPPPLLLQLSKTQYEDMYKQMINDCNVFNSNLITFEDNNDIFNKISKSGSNKTNIDIDTFNTNFNKVHSYYISDAAGAIGAIGVNAVLAGAAGLGVGAGVGLAPYFIGKNTGEHIPDKCILSLLFTCEENINDKTTLKDFVANVKKLNDIAETSGKDNAGGGAGGIAFAANVAAAAAAVAAALAAAPGTDILLNKATTNTNEKAKLIADMAAEAKDCAKNIYDTINCVYVSLNKLNTDILAGGGLALAAYKKIYDDYIAQITATNKLISTLETNQKTCVKDFIKNITHVISIIKKFILTICGYKPDDIVKYSEVNNYDKLQVYLVIVSIANINTYTTTDNIIKNRDAILNALIAGLITLTGTYFNSIDANKKFYIKPYVDKQIKIYVNELLNNFQSPLDDYDKINKSVSHRNNLVIASASLGYINTHLLYYNITNTLKLDISFRLCYSDKPEKITEYEVGFYKTIKDIYAKQDIYAKTLTTVIKTDDYKIGNFDILTLTPPPPPPPPPPQILKTYTLFDNTTLDTSTSIFRHILIQFAKASKKADITSPPPITVTTPYKLIEKIKSQIDNRAYDNFKFKTYEELEDAAGSGTAAILDTTKHCDKIKQFIIDYLTAIITIKTELDKYIDIKDITTGITNITTGTPNINDIKFGILLNSFLNMIANFTDIKQFIYNYIKELFKYTIIVGNQDDKFTVLYNILYISTADIKANTHINTITNTILKQSPTSLPPILPPPPYTKLISFDIKKSTVAIETIQTLLEYFDDTIINTVIEALFKYFITLKTPSPSIPFNHLTFINILNEHMIYNGDNFSFIYDNYYINYFIETAINNNKKLIKIKGGAYTNERLTRKNINKTINKYTRKMIGGAKNIATKKTTAKKTATGAPKKTATGAPKTTATGAPKTTATGTPPAATGAPKTTAQKPPAQKPLKPKILKPPQSIPDTITTCLKHFKIIDPPDNIIHDLIKKITDLQTELKIISDASAKADALTVVK